MTIKEFVNNYTQIENNELQGKMVSGIISHKYVSVVVKTAFAKRIIEEGNSSGPDSVGMYLLYVISVLQMYTNLDINTKKISEDYDLLQEQKLVDIIFYAIGDDLKEYQTIFNMCRDDYEKRNYSVGGLIDKIANSIVQVGDQIEDLMKNNPELKKILNDVKELKKS